MNAILAQLEPAKGAIEANVETACEVIRQSDDADLVVFPELFLSGYDLGAIEELAVVPEGNELEKVRRVCLASGTGAIVGLAEVVPGGVSNSAVCLDSAGTLAGTYRKTHLFGEERERFVPGDSLRPVKLAGWNIGVMICFDMEFPEVARTLAKRGAEMLITISANMDPFAYDHEVFSRARALENGLEHLYVNRVGDEYGLSFVGGSRAVSPEGQVLAQADSGARILRVSAARASRSDPRTHYLEQLRPALYAGEGTGKQPGETGQATGVMSGEEKSKTSLRGGDPRLKGEGRRRGKNGDSEIRRSV